jgi:hypothetical protein
MVIVVGIGILISQLFALGHLTLFAHEFCEPGRWSTSNDWRGTHRLALRGLPMRPQSEPTSTRSCNPLATPPAVASVIPSFAQASPAIPVPLRLLREAPSHPCLRT